MPDRSGRGWVGDMAAAYDRWLVPTLFVPCAGEVAPLLAARAPHEVLELAAGTGILTKAMLEVLPGSASVTATDLSPAMVEVGSSVAPGATWQQADAMDLPFDDARFDAVVCQFGVMFFPDRPAAMAEACRVLRPGGRLVLAIWDAVETQAFAAPLQAALEERWPDDPPRFLTEIPYGYHDTALVEADVRAGGFAEVSVEQRSVDGTSPSAADVTRGFCLGTPLRAELEARGPLDRLVDALADDVTARLGSGPVSGPMGYLLVDATA